MAIICKSCGNDVPEENKFCDRCGTPIDAENMDSQGDQGLTAIGINVPGANISIRNGCAENPQSYNSTINVVHRGFFDKHKILIIVAVVIVGALGMLLSFSSDSKNGKKNNTVVAGQNKDNQIVNKKTTDNSQTVTISNKNNKLRELIETKEKLDIEISEIASRANEHLKKNSDFRGQSAARLIGDAKKTLNKVENAQKDIKNLSVTGNDEAVKSALTSVFYCEEGRIRGMYRGMLDSKNNGDYMIGFKEGTAAAYKYDDENEKLNKLIKK